MDGFNIFDHIAEEYEFLSKIKYGGSSNLFLLYDKTCGRKVLLKSGRTDLIENEAHTLSELSGEGIPEVYRCFEHEDTAYLFRQYIEGRTLQECLKNDGAFTLKKTVEMGIAVCKIISRLHKYDPPIIHRDIKSDNIILTHDGKIYIIDLGISREFNPAVSRDTVVMGTLSTAPPEQFGYKQTDVRSDIYSIGVLLHEMMTGETALDKGKFSRKISYIIKKCTMFSPDDRYHSVDDIEKALRKLLYRRKNFIKVIAVCIALSIVFAFLGAWLSKMNITLKYALLSNADSDSEDSFEDSFMDSLEIGSLKTKYYFSFNDTSGNAVPVIKKSIDTDDSTSTKLIEDSSKQVKFTEGKVGKALYLNGTYGLRLPVGELGSSYTIAFWVRTLKEMTDYMPMLQAGTNLADSALQEESKWMNITKTSWFEYNMSPVIWTRDDEYYENVEDNVYWPWYHTDLEGKNAEIITPENGWQHIIVTVDGAEKLNWYDENVYSSKSNTYINGELYGTGVVVDDIFDADVTAYLGINCWDDLFVGYIDELQFYDVSITEEQAKEIFAYDGDKNR